MNQVHYDIFFSAVCFFHFQFSLPSKSSLFSNLSLSNVLGTKEQQKSTIPTPVTSYSSKTVELPSKNDTTVAMEPLLTTVRCYKIRVLFPMGCHYVFTYTDKFQADVPPGFGLSAASDILAGPPPGFESVCPDPSAPPGLAIPRAPQPAFSMVPFFSDSDLSRRATLSETEQKRQSEWSAVGAKQQPRSSQLLITRFPGARISFVDVITCIQK